MAIGIHFFDIMQILGDTRLSRGMYSTTGSLIFGLLNIAAEYVNANFHV